jgi:hypothetical protein
MTEHPSVARAHEILAIAQAAPLRAVLQYWLAIHPRDRLPSRSGFDPSEVPAALGGMVLTAVERDPFRFRIRLMGTAVVQAFGKDHTGKYLDEALPGVRETVIHTDRVRVAETGLPSYLHGEASTPFKLDFAPLERVYLPFASDGRTVDMILSMMIYVARNSAQRNWTDSHRARR